MGYLNGNKIMNIQVNGLVSIDDKLSATSENPLTNNAVSLNLGTALKGTKSGTTITLNDVSPIEHLLDIKLTSDTLTDFSSVEVARYVEVEGSTSGETIIQSQAVTANVDGTVEGLVSVAPNMTIMTDTDGVVIHCTYNRDLNIAYEELRNAILSLGGNI